MSRYTQKVIGGRKSQYFDNGDPGLVTCPQCNEHVNYTYLRAENPKCHNGHELGVWVHCGSPSEKHVYLGKGTSDKCPHCGSDGVVDMKEGMKVKCLHVTVEGAKCNARPYLWIKEGPPCFMNHVDKMHVV